MNKHRANHFGNYLLTGIVVVLAMVSARAQEDFDNNLSNYNLVPSSPPKPGWSAGVESGYVSGSSAKFQGQRQGDSSAFNLDVQAGMRLPLSDTWFLNVRLAE